MQNFRIAEQSMRQLIDNYKMLTKSCKKQLEESVHSNIAFCFRKREQPSESLPTKRSEPDLILDTEWSLIFIEVKFHNIQL